jgi:hypothetical protein
MVVTTIVVLGIVVLAGVAVDLQTAAAQDATPVPKPAVASPIAAPPSPVALTQVVDSTLPKAPDVTGGVGDSSVVSTDVFPSGRCLTGQGRGETVDEGFKIVVSGRCREDAETADIALPGRGISIGDGDIALDFKVLSGAQRAAVSMYVRNSSGKLIGATFNAATGEAKLFNFDQGNMTIIASRTDAQALAIPSDWNRLAVRVRANELWMLINDDAVLYATDVLTDVGGVGIRLLREGNPDDEEETAVVFRGLTISTVSGGGEGREPKYGQ